MMQTNMSNNLDSKKHTRMKLQISTIIIVFTTLFISCSKNDDNHSNDKPGMVKIEFDNSVNEDDLLLENSFYAKENNEQFSISELKYIISNIVLIDDKGIEFTYPKDESYFIINEKNDVSLNVQLGAIPAGTYTKIKFGLGVDQEKYLQGASGQGDLFIEAENEEMLWAWQAGYRFLKLEGNYKVNSSTTETFYKYHIGSHGSALDNYKEIALDLPVPAIIGEDKMPTVHIVSDIAKVFDGIHSMIINDNPQIMVNQELSPKVAENASKMFMVHHVHNGTSHH